MALSDFQADRAWENLISAETRALYFADLASMYARRQQWINGVSFFLASGAAATIVAKMPSWVPIALSIIVAVLSAYTIAVGPEKKIQTMAKLHSAWHEIAAGYDHLWNHLDAADAEQQLEQLMAREKAPSELASTDAPNDAVRMGKWQDHVFSMYHLTGGNA